jgi:hypothetical protein
VRDSWLREIITRSEHDSGVRIMAFLTAYIDESGTDEKSKTVVIAAAVARNSSWLKLESAWKAILKKHGVKAFHAKEFYHSRGEFKEWTQEMKERMASKLTQAIVSEVSWFFGSGVPQEDFIKVKREFSDRRAKPYQFLLEICLTFLMIWLRKHKNTQAMEIVIEHGQDFSSPGTVWLHSKINKYTVMQKYYKISKVSVVLKEGVIPFQIADFMAYELYRFGDSAPDGNLTQARQRTALQKIAAHKRIEGWLLKESDVRKWFEHHERIREKAKARKRT